MNSTFQTFPYIVTLLWFNFWNLPLTLPMALPGNFWKHMLKREEWRLLIQTHYPDCNSPDSNSSMQFHVPLSCHSPAQLGPAGRAQDFCYSPVHSFRIQKSLHECLERGHNIGWIRYGEVFWHLGDEHLGSASLCFWWSCMICIQSTLLLGALHCSRMSEH